MFPPTRNQCAHAGREPKRQPRSGLPLTDSSIAMPKYTRPPFPPNILLVENNPADAELVRRTLEPDWPGCRIVRVETRADFVTALAEPGINLIVSDSTLAEFDGMAALALARELRPELPLIFFSGTAGKDCAAEALRQGATDFVVKDQVDRLAASVRRALEEVNEHRRRRVAEQRLRDQAELLDKAQDAIFVRDIEDRVLYWNRSAERIYGFAAGEALGRRIDDLLAPGLDPGPMVEAKRHLFEHGEWSGEIRKSHKSGRFLDIMARWTLVRDDRGGPKHILCIESDVTEQRSLQSQLLRAQRLESLGTLAGGIAHDLNNVLAPILMSLELLHLKVADPEMRRLLDVLGTSAQHGADLIRQILAFARGSEGARAEFQPRLIMRDVARLLGETLPRDITIDLQAPQDLRSIMGNATHFHQVLMNLCVNARDAMPNGGRLLLQAENVALDEGAVRSHPGAKAGEFVRVSVRDTGGGIPAEIVDRIFDPFFSTKEPGRGTGLGLSTVMGIVRSHDGFVEVATDVGVGTEFRVFLPAALTTTGATSPATAMARATGRGEVVLLIDDEESVRVIASSLLETYGYRPIVASDGMSGVELYRKRAGEIDVVVTDMIMPGMQGPEVVAAVRAINPDASIVVMSGMLDAEKGVAPVETLGSVVVMQKPMSGEEMLRSVRKALADRRSPPAPAG